MATKTHLLQTPDLTARLILGPTPSDDRLATVIVWRGRRLAIGHDALPAACWDALDAAWSGARRELAMVTRPAQGRGEAGGLHLPEAAWIVG